MTECLKKCFQCENPGEVYANFSQYHRFCLSCIYQNLSTIGKCIHCSSIILISNSTMPQNSDSQLINSQPNPIQYLDPFTSRELPMPALFADSQLINSQPNPIQYLDPSTSLEPPEPALAEILKKPNPDPIIPRTQIPPNRPEMFPCVFCNKFHEATLCPSREISHCDLCLRTKNEYLNEYRCGHKACAGCFLQGECTLCDHPDPIIPRIQILPNHPEMFPCVFCNKFHETTLCPPITISHCDLCIKINQINKYLN